jgi:hypothetical protein
MRGSTWRYKIANKHERRRTQIRHPAARHHTAAKSDEAIVETGSISNALLVCTPKPPLGGQFEDYATFT